MGSQVCWLSWLLLALAVWDRRFQPFLLRQARNVCLVALEVLGTSQGGCNWECVAVH